MRDNNAAATVMDSDRPRLANLDDKRAIEATPLEQHYSYRTTLDMLDAAAERHGAKTAVSFQLTGKPNAKLHRMSFAELRNAAIQCANALHAAGVKPGETVATLLPNLPETFVAILGGHAIGAISPINPLLEPDIIAGILRESGATALVTLAPFPKTDVAEKAAKAVAQARGVQTVIEIDLAKYLPAVLRPIIGLLRPKRQTSHHAQVSDFAGALRAQPGDRLAFQREITSDTVGALFHTGGTTGTPKLAQHNHRGMVYNSWMTHLILFRETDVMLCALPLFHVFASYPMALSGLASGAELVMLSPQGFRGEGVIDNFWKLVERHRATFFCAVPTAIAALDQRPVDADVSTLRYMISGSAPLPQALFRRFEEKSGLKILEGYGMTEATCVTSANPPDGERKIGSVGVPLPFMNARICHFDGSGGVRDCATDEVGEICFNGPCVFPGYKDASKNEGLFFDDGAGRWLRTGDLGRIDADGYIWITGRAKDLIIRGGHNIDPGLIEEALAQHPAVAFVGAIGQPDSYAGEMPCAYVELKEGASATPEELQAFAEQHVAERAARPAHVTVMDELPKTAVGKIFKPALRHEAIARTFGQALAEAGVAATVTVEDDKKLGMVAVVHPQSGEADQAAIGAALNGFSRPWRLAGG